MSGGRPQLVDLDLDRGSPSTLQVQVYRALQSRILEGALKPGVRLPPTRDLARDLGVSRNTVVAAYDQLSAEGYVTTRTGSGTRVADDLPDDLVSPPDTPERDNPRPAPAGRHLALPDRVQDLISRQRPGPRLLGPFEPGLPDTDLFPFDLWARMTARFWRRPSRDVLLSGEIAGFRPLRDAIAGYLVSVRGLKCTADQVIITSGAQQGIDLTARVLLSPGDDVVLETPGYRGLRAAFGAAGAALHGVPVDEEGLDLGAAARAVPRPRLVAITPSHQFPLGVVMSLPRRLALLDWAAREGFWILEDDYDSEYRYSGQPISALQGLEARGSAHAAAGAQRVIYTGSFSKVLFPALRIGFLVVPDSLVDPFLRVRAAIDDHPSIAIQPVLADFIAEGHFASHLRRTRQVYGTRQSLLRELIADRMGGVLDAAPNTGGMHFCARFQDKAVNDGAVSARARDLGVSVPAISAYQNATDRPAPGLVLGFAGYKEDEIAHAAERLTRAVSRP